MKTYILLAAALVLSASTANAGIMNLLFEKEAPTENEIQNCRLLVLDHVLAQCHQSKTCHYFTMLELEQNLKFCADPQLKKKSLPNREPRIKYGSARV